MQTEPKAERQQRITLHVQGQTLTLHVPASSESYYRHGTEELNLTIGLYRQRFPLQGNMPEETHLTMAAIDIAYRAELWRREASTRDLTLHVESLSTQIEQLCQRHELLLARIKECTDSEAI